MISIVATGSEPRASSRSRHRRGSASPRGSARHARPPGRARDRDHLDRGERLRRPGGQLLDRFGLRAARQLRREVGDRGLVDLDRVVAGTEKERSPLVQLVAGGAVAALLARTVELLIERVGGERRARALAMSADSTSSTAGIALQRSSSSGSSPNVRCRRSQRPGCQQAADHRPHPQRAQQRRLAPGALAARPRPRGRPTPTGTSARVRRRIDRHAVAPLQAGRAPRPACVLARLKREHDHRQPPAQLVAVVPAQPLSHPFGGEREGTGGSVKSVMSTATPRRLLTARRSLRGRPRRRERSMRSDEELLAATPA